MPTQDSQLQQLLEEVAQGSDEAAWQIVERYSSNISRLVCKKLPVAIRGKVDAADIVNSIWASLLTDGERLVQLESPTRFLAYLSKTAQIKVFEVYRHFTQVQRRQVAEHRLSDYIESPHAFRYRLTKPKKLVVGHSPTASAVACAKETWSRIMHRASARDQRLVELRLQGYTFGEIAEELEIDKRTAKRALRRLLDQMSE